MNEQNREGRTRFLLVISIGRTIYDLVLFLFLPFANGTELNTNSNLNRDVTRQLTRVDHYETSNAEINATAETQAARKESVDR